MSNSNGNDIEHKNSLEGITDFDSFRNRSQHVIDFVLQNWRKNIDINDSSVTLGLGSKLEDYGWQFKINNAQLAQSNTNTNDAQNLSSENEEEVKNNVNPDILNEITFGLDKQAKNPQAWVDLFLRKVEKFELKIDSAEILWLLEKLALKGHPEISRYRNKLSEIFGRYIKKLIHRSEILQLEEAEKKLLTDSLRALASWAPRILFNKDNQITKSRAVIERFKTNFQQLEQAVTQRILSINSASSKESIDRAKSKSEVVNDVFAVLIDGIQVLNRFPSDQSFRHRDVDLRRDLFCDLMEDIEINLKDLSLEDKLEIIKFLSKESFRDNVPKAEFDYLDYHNWDWERYTDIDSMFRLTIDRFDYHNLDIDKNSIKYYTRLMNKMRYMGNNSSNSLKGEIFKLVDELEFPNAINVIKNCHLSFLRLCFKKYKQNDTDELRDDIKNVLRALLKHYKSNSKINSIIADLWEVKFKAQINYFLDKKYDLCQLVPGLSDEIKQGIAEDIKKLFTEVKVAFLSDIQPGTAFEVFKILSQQNGDDKLKELVSDGNIVNLFLEYIEEDVKNDRSNEYTDEDLTQFNFLITEIKNKNTSGELSIDDKSSIVRFFVNKDFDYVNNLAQITNKLKKLILKNDILDDNISSKENKGNSDIKNSNGTKNDLKINEQTKNVVQNKDNKDNSFVINNGIKNELSNDRSNTKEEKEKAKVPAQKKQEFKLEITLSNNKIIILSPSSCQTAIAELRKCSDFCYQICSIKEAIEQQGCPQAFECWKELCNKFKWWESIKVTFYSWFLFGIAKRWDNDTKIEIKPVMPAQSDNSFLKVNRDDDKFSSSESEEKTFGI